MAELRALLFTDVVDSTRLDESLGDAAASAHWATHDRMARDLLQAWRGREIDKADGLLLMFDDVADAAHFALAYHRALAALDPPMQARAGLHTGPVTLRANAIEDVQRGAKPVEVEGIAKPTAARVMSVAQGGQTLLSASAREALGTTDLRVQSHGHWRLKGLAEPIELFETGDAVSPFTPPPDGAKAYRVVRQRDLWLPLQQIKHSLPAERDAFVGRHEPLYELARRFESGARLISVVGIGGTGKTRLATHFAWNWLGDFPGGAWFCDLSQARSVDGIVHAVAQGIEVPLGKEDAVVQLGHAIAGRGACLVLLDNFEQVARYSEETLGHWLNRAAEARFIVTTREVLGLGGEEALALAPLPSADAATLFLRRAESAKHNFHPSADDRAAIGPLVRLLDGLPLAIELAAARVRVMPPRALLARMDKRFQLLTAGGGRQDRQATLRATFDWSWDLLAPHEKAALAQLSVFEGGFTIEAAEAVLALPDGEAKWTIDVLQSLVDKSFVRTVSDARFDLISSVQDYAAEHLRTPGRYPESGADALAAAEARHFAYFASIDAKAATTDGCVELGNLVVACRRAAAQAEVTLAASALERAWMALELHGPFSVGADLAARVQAVHGLQAGDLARVGRIAGAALHASGNVTEAKRHLQAALAAARESRLPIVEAQLHSHMGDLLANEGHADESRKHLAMALTMARHVEDRTLECAVLNGLGNLCNDQGWFDEASSHYIEALGVARGARDRRWEGGLLGNLGNVNSNLGKMDEARRDYEASLLVARDVGDRRWEGNALSNLGLLNLVQMRLSEAHGQFEASLLIAREMGHRRLECIVLCNLGIVQDAQNRADEARANFELALSVARDLADRRSEGQVLGYLGLSHARQARFDEARHCLIAGELLLQNVSDPTSLALLQCARAEAELLADQPDIARQIADAACEIAQGAGAGPESELGIALSRVMRLVGGPAPSDPQAKRLTGC